MCNSFTARCRPRANHLLIDSDVRTDDDENCKKTASSPSPSPRAVFSSGRHCHPATHKATIVSLYLLTSGHTQTKQLGIVFFYKQLVNPFDKTLNHRIICALFKCHNDMSVRCAVSDVISLHSNLAIIGLRLSRAEPVIKRMWARRRTT